MRRLHTSKIDLHKNLEYTDVADNFTVRPRLLSRQWLNEIDPIQALIIESCQTLPTLPVFPHLQYSSSTPSVCQNVSTIALRSVLLLNLCAFNGYHILSKSHLLVEAPINMHNRHNTTNSLSLHLYRYSWSLHFINT